MENNQEKCPKRKNPKIMTAITLAIVVLVIALNIAFSLFGDRELLYIDISQVKYTSGKSTLYTLSDGAKDMVRDDVITMIDKVNAERESEGKDAIPLRIVFCADRDEVESDTLTRYVSYTARALEKEFPNHIEVEYVNMTKNPSAVQKFKTTSAATINNSDVIVEFGTEYLVQSINAFYLIDSTTSTPWAYNGEKRLTSMMLALTRAESPICCITYNHGETLFDENGTVKETYTSFIELIKGAGYEPMFIDLEKDEIPENCRMLITFDPREDFKAFGSLGENGVSEIEKLDKYLDGINSFFYICGADTPSLKNLDEYLIEWGITIAKGDNDKNLVLEDKVNCADGGIGNVILGNYATEGVGAVLTEDMRDRAYPPAVVFGNSAMIVPPSSYFKTYIPAAEDGSSAAFSYYYYYKNGNSRDMLDIFTTHNTASALEGDKTVQIATDIELFKLMTITQEVRNVQEDNLTTITQSSYVLALASTDFCTNAVLNSTAYGNTDVILSALRNTSSEVVPTNIDLKAFYEYEMADEIAYAQNSPAVWTYCLIGIPTLLVFAVGVIVTVRRKYR